MAQEEGHQNMDPADKMLTVIPAEGKSSRHKKMFQESLAEFVAMTLFVVVGCGTAMGCAGSPGWVLQVSLAFGLAITVLAYTIGHYSGGHINCAVTFGLVLTGHCCPVQGLANLFAQILGSISGAAVLCLIFPEDADLTKTLGSNGVGEAFEKWNALFAEIFGTFLLMFVVLQTACNQKSEANRAQACLAIGFAVFLAHTVLIPIDGCSINPTRSLGPPIIASARNDDAKKLFEDMWIFWLGPLIGAALAAGLYKLFIKLDLMILKDIQRSAGNKETE
jgi:MIP family channel proteins